MYVQGKNFMFYVECKTLTGDVMLPLCSAESVQLGQQSRLREVAGDNDSKSSRWAYGILDNTLDIDGLITYSADQIQSIIVEVNNALLETNNALVSVGGVPVNDLSPYFCFENALNEWKYLNWYCEDQNNPGFKYKGVVLVAQIQNSWAPNENRKFSCSLQIDGDVIRFHTPIPTNLNFEGQSNTLPAETATFVENGSDPQLGAWTQRFLADGVPLPGGIFHVAIYGDDIQHVVNPGDTLEEVVLSLASQITAKQYAPPNPPPALITAGGNGDTLEILMDFQHSAVVSYTNHTGTLRSVFLKFTSLTNYDFYRIKVNDWIIDVTSNQPTIILPLGTYQVSVAGMGSDMQYSDYSETINITVV